MAAFPSPNNDALRTWLARAISTPSGDRHLIASGEPEEAALPRKESIVLHPVVEKWRARFNKGL
jgi:hypothetical protein